MARAQKGKSTPATPKAPPAAAEVSAPAVSAVPEKTPAQRAQELRAELIALKEEIATRGSSDPVVRWLSSAQENDVRAFAASKSQQMDQRKYQMALVKDFIDDPSRFGLDPVDIPSSTSLQEFAERRSELEYRIALMRGFLDVLTEELRVLTDAEATAKKNNGGGGSTH